MKFDDAITELLEVAKQWAAAERRRDTDFLETLLTADFVGIGPCGTALTKEQWLSQLLSSSVSQTLIHLVNVQVRLYGDVAILNWGECQEIPVSANLHVLGIEQRLLGIEVPFKGTLIFVRRRLGWKLAGCQMKVIMNADCESVEQ